MRQKLVKHKSLDDIHSKRKYWDWHFLKRRNDQVGETSRASEHPQANPDELGEGAAMYHVTDEAKEVQRRVQKLLGIAKQILTEQQYKVFFFLTERTMTERQVAKVLGISQPRVHALWETAREKLQRAYDERTA